MDVSRTKIDVALFGATGYTGREAARLSSSSPQKSVRTLDRFRAVAGLF